MNNLNRHQMPAAGSAAAEQWLQRSGNLNRAIDLQPAWNRLLLTMKREAKILRDGPPRMFPHFTVEDRWELLDVDRVSRLLDSRYEHGNWTAGFSIGLLWLNALNSEGIPSNDGESAARTARRRLEVLATRADDHTTHDLGFLFYPSYAFGQLLGHLNSDDVKPALQAARQLASRYNPRTQLLQAFGPIGHRELAGTSTIDTMMNLPLLFWAGAHGGDPLLLDIARRHARSSARLYFRADGSTYHLLTLDPISGALLKRGTFQGAGDESCWSRGQAWATCGFAWAFGMTGEWELLEAAERAATYFLERLPETAIPPWDFTTVNEDTKDASASAAVALGCLILAELHPDREGGMFYKKAGNAILDILSGTCLNSDPNRDGILQHSCYSKPHDLGTDSATGWGDFFFSLALAVAAGRLPVRVLLNGLVKLSGGCS
jgi:unsaturated chondroitin disaccharide hydrolase